MVQDFLIYLILVGFVTLLGFLGFYVFQLKKRLDIFLKGKNRNLEALLKDLISKSEKEEKEIQDILNRISKLENIAEISLQKVGVVRYNPFQDSGGNQSFSIALLDKNDSGFVITSLHMREQTRIFAKPIKQGKSSYPLSGEENKALEQAKKRLNY